MGVNAFTLKIPRVDLRCKFRCEYWELLSRVGARSARVDTGSTRVNAGSTRGSLRRRWRRRVVGHGGARFVNV